MLWTTRNISEDFFAGIYACFAGCFVGNREKTCTTLLLAFSVALLYESMNEDRNFGRRTGNLLESKIDQKLVQEFRLRKEEICLVCEIVR